MKNKTLTAILLCLLPLLLTACTLKDLPVVGKLFGGSKVTSKPVTLNVWGLWEGPEVMNTLIQKYRETHPNVTINYDDRSVVRPSQYKETVIGRLLQGGAPDILLVHNSWVADLKNNLSPMPSEIADVQKFSQTFYPVVTQSAVVDGKIYAIPAHYDGLVLVYNKKHFSEIDQSTPPTAWEEFRRLALSLTIKTEGGEFVRSGAAMGTADNIDFFSDILSLMFAQAGVTVPQDLDSKAAQDALSYYTNFVNVDKVWANNLPEATKAFVQGKVSMIFVPTWNLLDIIKTDPTMDIGVAPVPQAVPANPISWASFWMYAVPKSSQNIDAAWDFINFLGQDEQELMLFNESAKFRAYGAPFSSVVLASQATSGATAKYIKPALDAAPFAKSGYFAGRAGNALQVDALKAAVNALISEREMERATPEVALKACKEKITGVSAVVPTQ